MNIIEIYNYLEASYKDYICCFVSIKDGRVEEAVTKVIDGNGFLPKAFIQLKPDFAQGIRTSEMIHKGIPIHENFKCFFKTLFYKHCHETIKYGCRDKLQTVASGTILDSLGYLCPLFSTTYSKSSGRVCRKNKVCLSC